MTIRSDGTKWHSKLYDKKAAMVVNGLKLNKFPHARSKLSTQCKYNVITSQLHRYKVVCTCQDEFRRNGDKLYDMFIDKGYHMRQVNYFFERFMRNNFPECRADVFHARHSARMRHGQMSV